MKLSQLKEARYAGHHPAVAWIEKQDQNHGQIKLNPTDMSTAVEAIDRQFGEHEEVNTQGNARTYFLWQNGAIALFLDTRTIEVNAFASEELDDYD